MSLFLLLLLIYNYKVALLLLHKISGIINLSWLPGLLCRAFNVIISTFIFYWYNTSRAQFTRALAVITSWGSSPGMAMSLHKSQSMCLVHILSCLMYQFYAVYVCVEVECCTLCICRCDVASRFEVNIAYSSHFTTLKFPSNSSFWGKGNRYFINNLLLAMCFELKQLYYFTDMHTLHAHTIHMQLGKSF